MSGSACPIGQKRGSKILFFNGILLTQCSYERSLIFQPVEKVALGALARLFGFAPELIEISISRLGMGRTFLQHLSEAAPRF